MALEKVCKAAELPVGAKKAFALSDRFIILYHLEDGFYATQRLCTHTFTPLDLGKIIGGEVIQCPLHRARFEIRTGAVKRWANFPLGIQLLNPVRGEKDLTTYRVVVKRGAVYVEIEAEPADEGSEKVV
ncbi:MAG: Rieske 2Fe-2S domain-containing protein [Chloroflexi bacterium]|nr:Rieske 2Fe-2S domain-containing protein [Chloroflexota bacterium]